MADIHQIGELLHAGATPSAEEVEHLQALGAFVTSMYGRYVHGTEARFAEAGKHSDWTAHLTERLGASTGTRWERGIGLGSELLSENWHGFWQISANGPRAGYDFWDDPGFSVLDLWDEDAGHEAVTEPEAAPRRRRRGSLFGPRKTSPRAARRTAAAKGAQAPRTRAARRADGATRPMQLQWTDGSFVSLNAITALESGGLFVGDQLSDQGAPLAQRAAQQRRARRAPIGQVDPLGQVAPMRSRAALMDGLLVDDRTPALTSALSWAEAAFSESAVARTGLAVTGQRIADMVPAVSGVDRGRGAGARPVFAFFDSVEGDFVALSPEQVAAPAAAAAAAAPAAATRQAPSMFARQAPSVQRTAAPPPQRAGSQVAPVRTAQAIAQRAQTPIATSLSRMTPHAASASSAVRPYTGGVFPDAAPRALTTLSAAAPQTAASAPRQARADWTPSAVRASRQAAGPASAPIQLATELTYTRGGVAQPRVHRGGMSAPRVALATAQPVQGAAGYRAPLASGLVEPTYIGMEASDAPTVVGTPPVGAAAGATIGGGYQITAAPSLLAGAVSGTFDGQRAQAPMTIASTQPLASSAASWKLAADRGPDLPLGATLTRQEVFGAAASRHESAFAAPQMTTIGGARDAAPRGMALSAQSPIDGTVWISLAADMAADAQTPGHELRLATVPSGRQATMMAAPAALDLLSQVSGAAGQRSAAEQRALASGQPIGNAEVAAIERRMVQQLRSGVVGRPAPTAASAASAPAIGGSPEIALATSSPIGQVTSMMQSAAPQLGGARMTGFSPGAYARFDETRALLQPQAALDAAAPDAVAPTATAPRAPSMFQRAGLSGLTQVVPARTVAPATSGRTLTPAMVRRLAALGDMTSAAAAPLASRVAPTTTQAAFGAGAGPNTTEIARTARRALRRPVATAREALAVAPLVSGPSGLFRSATAMAASSPMDTPALSAAVSSRAVARQQALAADSGWFTSPQVLERFAQLDAAEVQAVSKTLRLAGWTNDELQLLALAGPESTIDAVTGEATPVSRRTQRAGQQAGALASMPAAQAAPTAARSEATAAQISRNLARVLAGAETVAGPVASGMAPEGSLTTLASAAGPGWSPLLAQALGDSYFGTTAPSRLGARRGGPRLDSAVGELVAIAEQQAAVADSPVEAVSRDAIFRRALRTRASAERATSRRSGVMGEAAGIGAEPTPPTATAELVDALFARAGGGAALVGEGLAPSALRQPAATLDRMLATQEQALLGFDMGDAPTAQAETAAEGAARPGRSLDRRLGEALATSSRGPAGARRLLATLASGTATPAGTPLARTQRARQQRAGQAAEQELLATPSLASALGPEIMLSGVRSAAVSRALARLGESGGRAVGRAEIPGILAALVGGGDIADETAPQAAGGRFIGRTETPGALTGIQPTGRAAAAARAAARSGSDTVRPQPSRRSHFSTDAVQTLVAMLGGDDGAATGIGTARRAAFGDRPVSRRDRASVLQALVRGSSRREMMSLFEAADASQFAHAWLDRVDGSRTGLELGFGAAREQIGATFGSRTTTSRIAGDSPIHGAGLVDTARAPRGGDRSGLRSLAAHSATGATGAARSSHGASAQIRRTDWRFVETGSRSSTPHADLGKFAAAIVGSNSAASRAPMPLVAPAIKAVAQTALRKPASEAPARRERGGAGGGGAQQEQKTAKPGQMSEAAIETLAVELANRIQVRLRRDKERKGVWA